MLTWDIQDIPTNINTNFNIVLQDCVKWYLWLNLNILRFYIYKWYLRWKHVLGSQS